MVSSTTISSIQVPASKAVEDCQEAASGSAAVVQLILHIEDLPLWMQGDPLIRRGYRRQSDSFQACFWSLFYSHNELINIWSHLLPGCFFLGLLLAVDYSTLLGDAEIPAADSWMIQIYVAGVTSCLLLSVSYSSPGIPLLRNTLPNFCHMSWPASLFTDKIP